ncbi:MAG: ABC transporter ATP-binding protein [Rhizobiaceae bacterium]
MAEPLLSLRGVGKTFSSWSRHVRALIGVNLDVARGSCHAIVGESGSGKSTLANLILGIYPPSEGAIVFDGQALPSRRPLALKRRIQFVQQNPLATLNPKRTIGASIGLPLLLHGTVRGRADRRRRVGQLLEEVGLPADFAGRSPAMLSGGQRQRVSIARALACEPDLLVLDEPTSALDVLVQARILQLIADLRSRNNLTLVFITHDLAVVNAIADRVSVFRNGELLETSETEDIFLRPRHPYTSSLIASVPVVNAEEVNVRDRAIALSRGHPVANQIP